MAQNTTNIIMCFTFNLLQCVPLGSLFGCFSLQCYFTTRPCNNVPSVRITYSNSF